MATDIAQQPLKVRCMAWTGLYETSRYFPENHQVAAGNFDYQGISYGVLQWNLGTGSLQPLLQKMVTDHRDVSLKVLGKKQLEEIEWMLAQDQATQVEWGNRASFFWNKHKLRCPWNVLFENWGATDEMIQAQIDHAAWWYDQAKVWFLDPDYQLWSQRGYMLMFDISVQNGGISTATKNLILQDYQTIDPGQDEWTKEVQRMWFIADRRADAVSNPEWREDVRVRKRTIATGSGTVHGFNINGQADFNISQVAVDPAEI